MSATGRNLVGNERHADAAQPVARPFIKWVGGKTQLLPELRKHVPAQFGTYIEPFVGGGALFFDLYERGLRRAELSDANTDLIAAYYAVRDHVGNTIELLRGHETRYQEFGEKYYYEVRAQKIYAQVHIEEAAARLIFLNKTCFNGLYRVNKEGQFNVPHGKWKTPPTICNEPALRSASIALQRAGITCYLFEELFRFAKQGDFLYADPPYWPASATSDFSAYTAGGFSSDDQQKLRDVALEAKKRGVQVLLSNADVEPVRKLYKKGFEMRRVEAKRAINSVASKRGAVGELLIW